MSFFDKKILKERLNKLSKDNEKAVNKVKKIENVNLKKLSKGDYERYKKILFASKKDKKKLENQENSNNLNIIQHDGQYNISSPMKANNISNPHDNKPSESLQHSPTEGDPTQMSPCFKTERNRINNENNIHFELSFSSDPNSGKKYNFVFMNDTERNMDPISTFRNSETEDNGHFTRSFSTLTSRNIFMTIDEIMEDTIRFKDKKSSYINIEDQKPEMQQDENQKMLLEEKNKIEKELEYLRNISQVAQNKSAYHSNYLNGQSASQIVNAIKSQKDIKDPKLELNVKWKLIEDILPEKIDVVSDMDKLIEEAIKIENVNDNIQLSSAKKVDTNPKKATTVELPEDKPQKNNDYFQKLLLETLSQEAEDLIKHSIRRNNSLKQAKEQNTNEESIKNRQRNNEYLDNEANSNIKMPLFEIIEESNEIDTNP